MIAQAGMIEPKNVGVACPKCGCRHLLAVATIAKRSRTFRYRRCRHCGHQVVTKEEIVRDVVPHKGQDFTP